MTGQWQESDLRKRSAIAARQLEDWRRHARYFPLSVDAGSPGKPVRCGLCGQCVYFTEDRGGNPYQYTDDERLSLTVAHMRQVHEGMYDDGNG